MKYNLVSTSPLWANNTWDNSLPTTVNWVYIPLSEDDDENSEKYWDELNRPVEKAPPARTCECGSWAVKDSLHSDWCPDYFNHFRKG